jgi:hypothetical protein
MATLLKLNCWVLGEKSTRIFSVEIDGKKNVEDLKRAIKEEKMAFAHIDADSLDVWDVSIPIDDDTNFNAQVEDQKLCERTPMRSTRKLSTTFAKLDGETLHVVIKAPPISEHRYLFLSG